MSVNIELRCQQRATGEFKSASQLVVIKRNEKRDRRVLGQVFLNFPCIVISEKTRVRTSAFGGQRYINSGKAPKISEDWVAIESTAIVSRHSKDQTP